MPGPLNVSHLRSLIAVADRRSFTSAAQVLHVSQSTVSQHIRLLERCIEADLFVRGEGGVTLTPEGARFTEKARVLLADHDELLLDFAATAPRVRQPAITVGSTEHAAEQIRPRLLAEFAVAFPRHELSFTLRRSAALAREVQQGRLDLAVVLAAAGEAPGAAVGSLQLRWAASVQAPDLDAHDRIALAAFDEPCPIRARAVGLLAAAGRSVHVSAQAPTLDGVLAAARAGIGVALLPTAARLPAGLREVGGLPEPGEISVHLISRAGLPGSVEQAARGMLTGLLADLTRDGRRMRSRLGPPDRFARWREVS